MSETEVLPELKQIIGAMLFAAKAPISLAEMRRVMVQTAEAYEGPYREFAKLKESDLRTAIEALNADLILTHPGFHVAEVANGYRLQNDPSCGPWLRILLEKGRANRLSKPALETLAIVAYRQPATRSDIEQVRGVAVDAILRNLLDLQLVKIVGRSELPGRPWLFGTTQKFLEYFGLKDVSELPGIQELRRMHAEQERRQIEAAEAKVAAAAGTQGALPLEEPTLLPAPEAAVAAGPVDKASESAEEENMGRDREQIERDYEGAFRDEDEEDEDEEEDEEEEEEEDEDEDDEEEEEEEEELEVDAKGLNDEELEKEFEKEFGKDAGEGETGGEQKPGEDEDAKSGDARKGQSRPSGSAHDKTAGKSAAHGKKK